VTQARQAAERGVDIIIAQGGEAGGYGGTIATFTLLPQVVDAVRPVPIVAAGGIADGRGLAAALVLGAVGVNAGTRILASVEAPIPLAWKHRIVEAEAQDAVKVEVWNDISPSPGSEGYGTTIRALRTPFIDTWQHRHDDARREADRLRGEVLAAVQQGRIHELLPFAGESAGLVHDIIPAGEIVQRLMAEARHALECSQTLRRSRKAGGSRACTMSQDRATSKAGRQVACSIVGGTHRIPMSTDTPRRQYRCRFYGWLLPAWLREDARILLSQDRRDLGDRLLARSYTTLPRVK
jgi:nitronate monooxygenase